MTSELIRAKQIVLRGALVLAFGCPIALSPLHAQESASPPSGTIVGLAVDSVRGGVLRAATVTLSNTNRSQVTDTAGRFRFDSVATGSHTVRLSHPLLDTLGLTVMSPAFEIGASGVMSVILAVPSPKTIVSRKCSPDQTQTGTAALVGVVFDADTEMPSTGAEVVVAWTDYSLSKNTVVSTPRQRTGVVRSDGSFAVCGVPSDLATGTRARRGTDSTDAIPANFSSGIAIQSFFLPGARPVGADTPAGAAAPRAVDRGVLRGVVTDTTGSPVEGARVAFENDTLVAISDTGGRFILSGLKPGTRRVEVRKLGFEPVERAVELRSSEPTEIAFRLTKFVPVLETVRVSALRDLGLERVGFASRQRSGMGRYLSPEQLERWNSPRLNDALRMVPSLRMGRTETGQTYVTGRFGTCVRYFVDGKLWADRGEGPDAYLGGREIGAIEVYTPLGAPAEFMSIDRSGQTCATVVVWTRWKLRIN